MSAAKKAGTVGSWPGLATAWLRGRVRLRTRLLVGSRRIRNNISQLLQVTVGSALAYAFCAVVLGHEYPFLAAVAAAVGIGVTVDRRVRRALEIGCGATLGVLVGELTVTTFGSGVWQLAVTMFIGLIIGTMINSGGIFITQIGIQSIYVVTVPPAAAAQPLDRTTDALVGAITAILLALIVPSDARKTPRDRAASLLTEISAVLGESADALRRADPEAASRALTRARSSQDMIDSWRSSIRISLEETRINARSRRYAAEVSRLARAMEYADRSMRMVRVVSRRVLAMTVLEAPRPEGAQLLEDIGDAANRLRIALQRGTSRQPAEEFLSEVAGRLDPSGSDAYDMQDRTLILLLRPLVVDMLQAAGMTEAAALEELPAFTDDESPGPTVE